MKPKTLFLAAALSFLSSGLGAADIVTVYKSAGCGCCLGWMAHLRAAGFEVAPQDLDMGALTARKKAAGIGPDEVACHTAFVGGYVIEGHVPAADIARLLAEKPAARGLAVPGMPAGSPGMEAAGAEPYDVLILRADGSRAVFARH